MKKFDPLIVLTKKLFSFFLIVFFSQKLLSQPTISSFTPASGPVGTTVTINGTNFSATAANDIVFFGAVRATVTSATTTSLTVTVPGGATYQPITVTVNNLTAYSNKPFIVTFAGAAPEFTPQSFQYAARIDSVDSNIETTKYAIGDLNNDGKIDVVAIDRLNNTMSVYRNTSNGGVISFASKVDFTTGQSPRSVSIGDIDGDGKLDVVVSNLSDNTVSVFKNTSSGNNISFAAIVNFATATQPAAISITDIDKDGKPDLVVNTVNLEGYVSILRNTSGGAISFATKIDLQASGGSIEEIRTADLDGDGKVDVVLPNFSLNVITIFRNASTVGNIVFASPVNVSSFQNPDDIEIGDLDNDGKQDIVVGHYTNINVIVLRNVSSVGNIAFQYTDSHYGGNLVNGLAVDDLDGDGKPDVAADINLESLSLFKNRSSAGSILFDYSGVSVPALYTSHIIPGDFDNDGKPDLAFNTGMYRVTIWKNRTTSPQIFSFSPASGAPGDTITIQGANFSGINYVSFGGVAASHFTVVNATTITAVVNSGASGDIVIKNPNDSARIQGFIFSGPPLLSSFTPNSATTDSVVTITGLNFEEATQVTFGGTPATTFSIISPTTIRAVVASGSSGDVSVTTRYGSATLAGFTYIPAPKITSINPTTAGTGVTVTISGLNFTGTTSVTFGGTPALSFTIVDSATIYAVVGNGTSGVVKVTNNYGTGIFSGFTYIPSPMIASFSPTSAGQGATVTITGANFSGATSVTFGGTPALSFNVISATSITAVVGAGSSGSVSVTTAGGAGIRPGFVFIPAPTISSFTPSSAGVGAAVTITGTNFSNATSVSFGNVSASSFVVVNATTISAIVGNGASGNVSVTTPGGTAVMNGFIFVEAPVITSFTPSAAGTGLQVTIKGLNFSGATAVSFGGIPAASFAVVSATTITSTIGNGASGSVSVTTVGGTAVLPGFTYVLAPTITSFTPATSGRESMITITGTNFIGATSVTFGGTPAASFTVISPTSIIAMVGGGSTGAVTVSTAGGTATLPGFTFTSPAPPIITSFTPGSGSVGTTVIINGNNFDTTVDGNIIYFGSTRATVLSAGQTQLEVIVPPGASYHAFSVLNKITNLSGYSAEPFLVTFPGKHRLIRNSFAAKQELVDYNERPFDVVIFDADNDGKPDLAYTDELGGTGHTVSVYRNTGASNGMISFASKVEFAVGMQPRCLNYGDIDGDGNPDLVIANLGTVAGTGSVSILRNSSTPGVISFEPAINYATGLATNVVISDFDSDGKPDLAVTNFDEQVITLYRNTSIPGIISFSSKQEIAIKLDSYGIASVDLDMDGKSDLAVLSSGDNTISLFRNLSVPGAIMFAPKIELATEPQPYAITQGDIDGDGKPDLAVTGSFGAISVFRNTSVPGSLTFDPKIDVASESFPEELSLSDIDGDGKIDMAVSAAGPNHVAVLKNISSPGVIAFQPRIDYATASTPFGIDVADLDNDGKPDITTACDVSAAILRNQITAPAISSFSPMSGSKGDSITITGTNFTGATNVTLGGVATSFTVVDDSTIIAVVASGASGVVAVTNSDGTDSLSGFTYDVVTAVGNINGNSNDLKVYPNPAQNYVLIEHPSSSKSAEIQWIDISGRIVKKISVPRNETKTNVNTATLQQGIYKIVWGDGKNSLTKTVTILR